MTNIGNLISDFVSFLQNMVDVPILKSSKEILDIFYDGSNSPQRTPYALDRVGDKKIFTFN